MAMAISDSNYGEIVAGAGSRPVVIDFWATWCGPCRMIAPIVDELAQKYEGKLVITKCNVDENSALPQKFGIRNIPTLVFLKNGEVVGRHIGAASKQDLDAKLAELL
ncbi:MAG: thioredoxin [Bacteroidales bacterium]|nr:thioredoxin [Bacteroidales bacterium]